MSAPPAPPKAPLIALGLLTLVTFGGPLLILLTIRGGNSSDWPPDRPVEWWIFGIVVAAVVVLMTACLTVGLWAKKGSS